MSAFRVDLGTMGFIVAVTALQLSSWSAVKAQEVVKLKGTLVTGRNNSAIAGQPVRPAPVVRVTGGGGQPLPGIPVTAHIASPSGVPEIFIDGTRTVTNDQGEAVFDSLRIATPTTMPVDVAFLVNGQEDRALTLTLAVTRHTIADAVITAFPSARLIPGAAFSPVPLVQLRDDQGAPAAGALVRLVAGNGNVSFTGNDAVSNQAGLATFGDIRLASPGSDDQVKVGIQVFQNGKWELVGQVISVEVGPAPIASLDLIGPPPQSARAGEYFDSPLTLVVRDGSGNVKAGERVLLLVSEGEAQITGGVDTSDARGQVHFSAAVLYGRGGTEVSLGAVAAGRTAGPFKIHLRPGPPSTILVLDQPPPSAISDSLFGRRLRVRVVDNAGNPLEKQEVRVRLVDTTEQHVVVGGTDLIGPTSHRTSEDGEAVFDSLGISGRPGTYTIQAFIPGSDRATSTTNPIEYNPDQSLNRNFVSISAIKSIAGQIPDDEFFDIRFRYRLFNRFFVISATDIALTARTTDSVSSKQRRLTEATISLNFTFHRRADARNGVPERELFAGTVVKVFNTIPYAGLHAGVLELAGSPFQGSSLTFGPVFALYSGPVVIQHTTIRPQPFNILADFLVRSGSIDFFKSLNIRGSILLPIARGQPLSSRIGIAVPVGTLQIY